MKLPRVALGGTFARILPAGYLDLAKVVGGAAVRNALRGVFKVLIAGFLTPSSMGVVRAVYSFFKIVTSFAELGLDSAAVTLVAGASRRGHGSEPERILGTVLAIKLWSVAGLLVAGNLVAPRLTIWVFNDPSLTLYTRLTFFAVGGQLLWRYVHSYLSAHQEFSKVGWFLTTVPAMMLVASAVLIAFGSFSPLWAILIYLFAPGATAGIWWFVLRGQLVRMPRWDRGLSRRILSFGRWVYLSNLASTNRNHIGTLLLKHPRLAGSVAAGELQAGLYSFGNDLASEITFFSQSLLTVILPKASGKVTGAELKRFVSRCYRHLAWIVVPLLLFVFVAEPLVRLLGMYRETYLAYLPALEVFKILYCSMLFSVVLIPMQAALYAMNAPQFETYLELMSLPFVIVASILLIPRFGGEGAAYALLGHRVVASVVLMSFGLAKLRKWNPA